MLNRLFYTSAVSLLLFASACTPRQVARDVSEMATQVAPVAQQVLSTIVSATASTSPSTPTVPSPTPRRARVPASRPRSVTPPPSDVPIELGGAPLALTRTAHENIYVANGSPNSFVQEVIADAALTAQRMMQDEGWSGAPNVGIFVFPSREVWLQGIAQIGQLPQNQVQFQAQLGGDAWITISGTAHPGFYIYPIQQSPFETLHMLTHEYTHAIQRQVLGDSASVPDWFLEGMAEAEGWRIAGLTDARAYRQEHDEVSAFVRAAERRHRLPPLTSLSTSQSWEAHMESPRSATLEYAEGQLAIEYLQQLKGANAPMNILRATAAQGSFGEAFQQTAVDDSAIPSQF